MFQVKFCFLSEFQRERLSIFMATNKRVSFQIDASNRQINFSSKMNSRSLFVVYLLVLISMIIGSSFAVPLERETFHLRPRKLNNAAWLSAPHFSALAKRGRFVFREAPFVDENDFYEPDTDEFHPDKRNWRL